MARYETFYNRIITDEDMDILMDLVEKHGIAEYCEWGDKVIIAMYFSSAQAYVRGDAAVKALCDVFPQHNWIALGKDTMRAAGISYDPIFIGSEWMVDEID